MKTPLQDPRPVMAMLWELLELADLLGCPRLHLCVDHRQHPTQSLLTLGLAAYQVSVGEWTGCLPNEG